MLSAFLVAAAIVLASVSPGGPLASTKSVSGGGPLTASASVSGGGPAAPANSSSTDSVTPSGPL